MKYWIVLLSLLWIFPVWAQENFDSSCFREVAQVEVSSWVSTAKVENIIDDIFFVSKEGKLLPSRLDSTEKNPPIRYSTRENIDINALDDSDPYTAIEIDPTVFLNWGVSYIFDLGKVYKKWQIAPLLWYATDREVWVSVSIDGNTFVPVSLAHLDEFDMRYFQVSFSGSSVQNGITRFHTLNFFQKIQTRYSFSSEDGEISLYRSYACQNDEFQSLINERPNLPFTEKLPTNTYSITFSKNTSYRDDSDSDGLENLRDNCPLISNTNQQDRNYDGVGDACSDDDNDSRIGEKDNCPTVPNRDQADKNVNGIGDACEFDTDGDGVSDSIDNAIQLKNPDQKDTDNDRIGDVLDNCALYNPDQLDLDKNGKGDACDRDETYRKSNDGDKDGIIDFSDNCPKIANSDQSDSDSDGIGNLCDNCRDLKNQDQTDTDKNAVGDSCEDIDNDTFIGWRDNCPYIANIEQKDSDNNTIWDACSDIDGDTIYDSTDLCPIVYDKDQKDIDKDGIWDLCDTEDNRMLESNKYIFMWLIAIFGLIFIGGIVLLIRKLQ
jgi:hypothetical protein